VTTESILVLAIPSIVGIIVWAVRVEGRVNGHDREIQSTREDIKYVRERIDRALEP
jgi:hypothetical protein